MDVKFYAPDASGEVQLYEGKLLHVINGMAYIDRGTDHPFAIDKSEIIVEGAE